MASGGVVTGSNALGIGDISACPSGMSADAIRAAIARVIASPDFDVPDRAKRFLTYVVEETIAGRGDRIKAYSIATEVFGRDSSFDAQADPVVRIEAGRVRRALGALLPDLGPRRRHCNDDAEGRLYPRLRSKTCSCVRVTTERPAAGWFRGSWRTEGDVTAIAAMGGAFFEFVSRRCLPSLSLFPSTKYES